MKVTPLKSCSTAPSTDGATAARRTCDGDTAGMRPGCGRGGCVWPPRLWQRGEEAEEREGGELRGAEQSAEDDAPAEEARRGRACGGGRLGAFGGAQLGGDDDGGDLWGSGAEES